MTNPVAHSPGPWKASVDTIGLCIKDIDGDGGYPLCASFVHTGNSDFQIHGPWHDKKTGRQLSEDRIPNANALLIAAAPELLEALQALILSLKSMRISEGDPDLRKARAAIAKATGAA